MRIAKKPNLITEQDRFIDWMRQINFKYRGDLFKQDYKPYPSHVVEAIDHNLAVLQHGKGRLILKVD